MSQPPDNPIAPHVSIPLEIALAYERGILTLPQFHILFYAYFKANRAEGYRVSSYSAAAVCRFWQLIDPTSTARTRSAADAAIVKIYVRALNRLQEVGLILGDDYRQCDPAAEHAGRTYSIWLPRPEDVGGIIDALSLSCPTVMRDIVPQQNAASGVSSATSSDGVWDRVSQNCGTSSLLNQECEKESPPAPAGGVSHRSALPSREENAPAGVIQKPHMRTKSKPSETMSSEQAAALHNAVTLYRSVSAALFVGFSPVAEYVQRWLKNFTPTELLFAQINRIQQMGRFNKDTMAYFFHHDAGGAIEAAQLQGTSMTVPDWFYFEETLNTELWMKVQSSWLLVLENWNKIYPDRRDAGFPDPVLAARKRHAEQQAQQQPTAAAQEPQSPKPVIWDESRRWKLSCDAVRYATSLNARVGYSKQDADISFLRRALESVLWKTEEATKIHVTEDVLFAIIKEELALCGDDAALADFGTYLCMNLAEQLNARLQPATAGEKL